jgi:hypothetical protein
MHEWRRAVLCGLLLVASVAAAEEEIGASLPLPSMNFRIGYHFG